MSEHPEMRNLLGPYVMGSLEPREEREVEDHLRECADCKEEAHGLRIAHERLLDLAYATESPPQNLEERVVAAIPRRHDWRRLPTWTVAVAALFCVIAVLGTVFVPDLSGGRALASATLTPTDLAPDAGGHIRMEDAKGNMDVSLRVWGLPSCEEGDYYELWLVEGEERVSAGSFTVGPTGEIDIHMNAPGFAGSYPTVGITHEHDEDPRASDANVLSGELH
jgi:Anti-sigma-K factor rskA/Putative zinc-finger